MMKRVREITLTKCIGIDIRDEAVDLVKNAIPLTLSFLNQLLLTMMSLLFCGHLGPSHLAAVALSNMLTNIIVYGSINGLASACDTLLPQMFSSKDKRKFGLLFQKACMISLMAAILCTSLILNARYLLKLFINDSIVIENAVLFLHYYAPSILPFSLTVIMSKYLQTQLMFYPVLLMNLATNLINICLHIVFVYGFQMGVKGSALAISLANTYQTGLYVFYILINKIHLTTWPGLTFESLYDWRVYLRLGIAGFGLIIFELINFEIATIMSGTLGSMELNVMSITLQLVIVASMIPFGLGNAANIKIGNYLGENKPEKAEHVAKVVIVIVFGSQLILSFVFFVLSDYFPLIFTSHRETIDKSSAVFKFLSVTVVLDGLQTCGNSVIRSIGGQSKGLIISFIGFYLIGLPIGAYLLLKTQLKVLGYWFGLTIGCFIISMIQLVFIARINWIEEAQEAYDRTVQNQNEPNEETADKISMLLHEAIEDLTEQQVMSLKRQASNKIIAFLLIVFIFVLSLYTKDSEYLRNSDFYINKLDE